MFTPIHLLPQNTGDYQKYKERWESAEGKILFEKILMKIRNGAGENFLEFDFQAGNLGFLEDEGDLRGFRFFKEEINFPDGDNFQAIDFSFAEFWHSTFTNVLFNCTMIFTKFYNCTFKKCKFFFNRCYAASFKKANFIDCEFIESDSFTNCSFSETSFKNTFFHSNVFYDCLFDTTTHFHNFLKKPETNSFDVYLSNIDRSELYRAISEAYSAGRVYANARKYRFQQLRYSTRYNSQNKKEKISGIIFEYIAGYGLRPIRVLTTMILFFFFVLIVFMFQIEFRDALLLTCGALFTFGANSEILKEMNLFYQIIYIVSAFVGISLTTLFITVLVNVFINKK